MQVSDKEREQEQKIMNYGFRAFCGLLAIIVLPGLWSEIFPSAGAKLPEKSQPVLEAKVVEPKVVKPKTWNVESKEFKRKFYDTLLNALRKKGTHKWDSLVITKLATNSDNTVDTLVFKTTYKRRAYKLGSPVHERDANDVLNTAEEILRKAKVLETGWGGTHILCEAEGKRILDDKLPPVIIWNPSLGFSSLWAYQ